MTKSVKRVAPPNMRAPRLNKVREQRLYWEKVKMRARLDSWRVREPPREP